MRPREWLGAFDQCRRVERVENLDLSERQQVRERYDAWVRYTAAPGDGLGTDHTGADQVLRERLLETIDLGVGRKCRWPGCRHLMPFSSSLREFGLRNLRQFVRNFEIVPSSAGRDRRWLGELHVCDGYPGARVRPCKRQASVCQGREIE